MFLSPLSTPNASAIIGARTGEDQEVRGVRNWAVKWREALTFDIRLRWIPCTQHHSLQTHAHTHSHSHTHAHTHTHIHTHTHTHTHSHTHTHTLTHVHCPWYGLSFSPSVHRLWDLQVWLTALYLKVLIYWRLVPEETGQLVEQMQA